LERLELPKTHRLRQLPGQEDLVPYINDQVSESIASQRSTSAARLFLDQTDRCLVTNVHRHTDQLAHIINAQREDTSEKQDVESALVGLGITHSGFDLNNVSNMGWLDQTLHSALDHDGLYALTVSKPTALQLRDMLRGDLDRRQNALDTRGILYDRNFYPPPEYAPPEYVLRPELQLVVLHPHQFLPKGFPLARRRQGTDAEHDIFVITNDGYLRRTFDRNDLTAPVFPIEPQETTRQQAGDVNDVLNVWFLILNAEAKFTLHKARYGLDHLPPAIVEVIELTIEIVGLIYARPQPKTDTGFTGVAGQRWSSRTMGRPNYDENDHEMSGDEKSSPRNDPGEGGSRGNMSKAVADFLSLPPEEMAQAGREMFFGYSKQAARQDELFGRRPQSAYDDQAVSQWTAEVV